MKLSDISEALKVIVSNIPNAVFMRATSEEANKDVDDVDLLGKTIVIFNNLPTVPNQISQSGYVSRTWPIDLQILQLGDVDETTLAGDNIRDNCHEIADKIYDALNTQFEDQWPESISDYTIDFVNQMKLYDKILTGCLMSFQINLPRTVYLCP